MQTKYVDLSRTIDQLARRNAATEQDNRQLADQNTDLISHGNPHQRIRHVAQIREELAESRKVRSRVMLPCVNSADPLLPQRHLDTTSTLASASAENAALRAELATYRSVSPLPTSSTLMGPPATIPARSRVSRPVLDDVFTPEVSTRSTFVGASKSASTREMPRFVISEEEEPSVDGQEPEQERFASRAGRSESGFSISGSSSVGGRRAGRASGVPVPPMMGQRTVSSPAVRMSGKMTVDELFG